MEFPKISRRSFLEAAAATGAAATLSGTISEGLVPAAEAAVPGATQEGETRIVKTCCRAAFTTAAFSRMCATAAS